MMVHLQKNKSWEIIILYSIHKNPDFKNKL